MASSLYQQGLFNLITAKSVRRRQALRDRLIAYRKQFEHDGRALLHFRFPRLQKVHAFTDGVLIAVTCYADQAQWPWVRDEQIGGARGVSVSVGIRVDLVAVTGKFCG